MRYFGKIMEEKVKKSNNKNNKREREENANKINMKLQQLKGRSPQELLQSANIKAIPVDLNKLFKSLGINVLPADFTELENAEMMKGEIEKKGMILGSVMVRNSNRNKDEVGIMYRESDSINRIRFTVSHELGHCCLHTDKISNGHISYRNENVSPDEDEIAANNFASELLIPLEFLENFYKIDSKPDSSYLAKQFGVSTKVMEARLTLLNKDFQPASEVCPRIVCNK